MVQYVCDRCGEVMVEGSAVRVRLVGPVREGIDVPARYDRLRDESFNFELCDGCKKILLRWFERWKPRAEDK